MSRRSFRPSFDTLVLRLAPSTYLLELPYRSSTLAVEEPAAVPSLTYPPLPPLPPDFVDIYQPSKDPMAVPEMPPCDF